MCKNNQEEVNKRKGHVMKTYRLHTHTGVWFIVAILIVLLFSTVIMSPAAAVPITWNLRSVTTSALDWSEWQTALPNGTLSGWFTFDASTQSIGNWSVSAAINPDQAPAGLTNPLIFNPTTSVARYGNFTGAVPWAVGFSDNSSRGSIHLSIISSLLTPIVVNLYCYPDPEGSYYYNGGINFVRLGQLTPSVSEPSTLLFLGAGMVAVIGFRRKLRKS
jgi:hypothetical protein